MRITIVKLEDGKHRIHVRATRRGERKVLAREDVPQNAVGECVAEMVKVVRRDEPQGAPVEP